MIIRCFCILLSVLAIAPVAAQEVVVIGGLEDAIHWLQDEQWWGETKRGEQLTVPSAIMTGISPRWRETAQKIPVSEKKEIFYRFMLPLVLHANTMVLDRRVRLERMGKTLARGGELSQEETELLGVAAELLRISTTDQTAMVKDALYKLDIVPPGLALGQAAYESGYGTSRFAAEGNALFGQWTFGGEGLKPEQQRSELGDHRIAAYDWPFDSVRGYYLNLFSHPAYEDFRRLRAELRAAGKPLTSLALADGLIKYSERGQEYVDTLKGIIRVNKLDVADDAVFRDEPMRFLVSAPGDEAAAKLRKEIEGLRKSGELAKIIARMRLE
jgi:Bax protein